MAARQFSIAPGSVTSARGSMPALLMTIETWPAVSATRAATARQASMSVTSRVWAQASPPRSRIVAAVRSAFTPLMSVATTAAPCAARPIAMASPLPWPAPVTHASSPARMSSIVRCPASPSIGDRA